MTISRCESWDRVRCVEDLLALLSVIGGRCQVIRVQAWHEGSWAVVFAEATAMREELSELKGELAATWARLHAAAREDRGAG